MKTKTFNTNKNIASTLVAINEGKTVSRYLSLQLVALGLLKTEAVKNDGRGRPRVIYSVSGKGRGLIALSKNWK